MPTSLELTLGYLPADHQFEFASLFLPTLAHAVNICGMLWPCTGFSFEVPPGESSSSQVITTPRWYYLKQADAATGERPSVLFHSDWRSYDAPARPPAPPLSVECAANTCAGTPEPCTADEDAGAPLVRAMLGGSSEAMLLPLRHTGQRRPVHVYWLGDGLEHRLVTLVPEQRYVQPTTVGAEFVLRRLPPDDRPVVRVHAGAVLVRDCACGGRVEELGVGPALRAGAHLPPTGEAPSDTEDRRPGPSTARRERRGADEAVARPVHVFNLSARSVRLIRVRRGLRDDGLDGVRSLYDLGPGRVQALRAMRHGDVIVACLLDPVHVVAGGGATCDEPLLVHEVADVLVDECADDEDRRLDEAWTNVQNRRAAEAVAGAEAEVRRLREEASRLAEHLADAEALLQSLQGGDPVPVGVGADGSVERGINSIVPNGTAPGH